jgi:ATP-binding cassette subfamily B protein
MIGHFAIRYPGRIAGAAVALLVAASATLAIPNSFRLIIDRGFSSAPGNIDRWFEYLLLVVVVLAIATALRFYFVSWLGERVVADVRNAVQRNLLRLSPASFEENRPSEIASRLTADTTIIEQWSAPRFRSRFATSSWARRRHLSLRAGARSCARCCCSAFRP